MKNSVFLCLFCMFLGFCFKPLVCKVSLKEMGKEYASKGKAYPSANELIQVLDACSKNFKEEFDGNTFCAQKFIVPSGSKICFMGDIHGSFESVFNNFCKLIQLGFLQDDFKIIDTRFSMVFLGDYVDRGSAGVEVLYSLAVLKLQNWEKVFLLMGNHDNDQATYFFSYNSFVKGGIGTSFGFLEEIRNKYYPGEKDIKKIWNSPVFNSVREFFQWLPVVLFLGSGKGPNWIQCCHGGFEKELDSDLIIKFLIYEMNFLSLKGYFEGTGIDCQNCGLLWNDFYANDQKDEDKWWVKNYMREGHGYLINQIATLSNCEEYGVKAVFRGHQHSYFGLKIGGCEPFSMNCHWSIFEKGRLWQDVQKNENGFVLHNISFPVFTFSTAVQANVYMPYDCFGILTTADDYTNWRLMPYEFENEKQFKKKEQSEGVSNLGNETFEINTVMLDKSSSCCRFFCDVLCLPLQLAGLCVKECCCHKKNIKKNRMF